MKSIKKGFSIIISLVLILNYSVCASSDRIIIDDIELNKNILTISGTAAKINSLVNVMVINQDDILNADKIIYQDIASSGETGLFSFQTVLPDKLLNGGDSSGNYVVFARGEGTEKTQGSEKDRFYYLTAQGRADLASTVSNSDEDGIVKLFDDEFTVIKLNSMGILTGRFIAMPQNSKIAVSKSVLNNQNITADNLGEIFNTAMFLTEIKNSSEEKVLDILTSYNKKLLNLKYDDNITFENMIKEDNDIVNYICKYMFLRKNDLTIENINEEFKVAYVLGMFNEKSYTQYEGLIKDNSKLLKINTLSQYQKYLGLSSADKESVHKKMADNLKNKVADKAYFITVFKDSTDKTETDTSGNHGNKTGGGGSFGTATSTITKDETVISKPMLELNSASRVNFKDLDSVAWAVDSISKLYSLNVISGVTETEFFPNDSVKREEFIKMIIVALKLESSGDNSAFSDVPKDKWYYPYISTGTTLGIIKGVSEDKFGLGEKITRQDMAVIAKRAVEASNITLNIKQDAIEFKDNHEISEYAKQSVELMQRANIICGVSDNFFAPFEFATRAQAAVIIERIISQNGAH